MCDGRKVGCASVDTIVGLPVEAKEGFKLGIALNIVVGIALGFALGFALNIVGIDNEEKARKSFFSSRKDATTAKAFLNFLLKLHNGELLSTSSNEYLSKIMLKNAHGKKRLKGYLPTHSFEHKTGSFSMLSNDAGILTLPGNKGHVILVGSVMERKPYRMPDSKQFIKKRDDLLAILAKTVYDFFLFST